MNTEYNTKYITSLRNRVWKLLPIYEGRDTSGKVIFDGEKAHKNFSKNLEKLILEISGGVELCTDNAYYVELLYLLTGMRSFKTDEHDRIKYIVLHCADLCEKMKNGGD